MKLARPWRRQWTVWSNGKQARRARGALDQALNAGKPAVVDVKTNVEGIADRGWMTQ